MTVSYIQAAVLFKATVLHVQVTVLYQEWRPGCRARCRSGVRVTVLYVQVTVLHIQVTGLYLLDRGGARGAERGVDQRKHPRRLRLCRARPPLGTQSYCIAWGSLRKGGTTP